MAELPDIFALRALNRTLLLFRLQCEARLSPAQAQDQPLQKGQEQHQRDSVRDVG